MASVANTTPRPVAASLPNDPPRSYIPKNWNDFKSLEIDFAHWRKEDKFEIFTKGFPVTTAGE